MIEKRGCIDMQNNIEKILLTEEQIKARIAHLF